MDERKEQQVQLGTQQTNVPQDTTQQENLTQQENTPTEQQDYVDKPWRARNEKIIHATLTTCLILLVVVLLVRLIFFAQVQVAQNSMYPTYKEGEHLLVRKTERIERGQVVVFFEEGENAHKDFFSLLFGQDKLILKRVVACQGDKIWVEKQGTDEEGNDLYALVVLTADTNEVLNDDYYERNGQKVEIPLMTYSTLGILEDHIGQEKPLLIEEGRFFAMGDNRIVSKDSRDKSFGQIPLSYLLGVVIE